VSLLSAFHRQYPAIKITLAEDNSDRLADGVRDGRYDMAFIGTGIEDPPGLALHVVADEPVVAAFSAAAEHAELAGCDSSALAELTGCDSVTLAEIAGRTVISLPRGTGLRSAIDAAYASAGLRPHIAFEASDPRMLARLAAHGLGLAFLPASVAAAHGAGLHVLTIRDPGIRGRLALAWRTDDPVSPAARALIAHARAVLRAPN
jgi:DNA-binding transcriptional LysR family regulator